MPVTCPKIEFTIPISVNEADILFDKGRQLNLYYVCVLYISNTSEYCSFRPSNWGASREFLTHPKYVNS